MQRKIPRAMSRRNAGLYRVHTLQTLVVEMYTQSVVIMTLIHIFVTSWSRARGWNCFSIWSISLLEIFLKIYEILENLGIFWKFLETIYWLLVGFLVFRIILIKFMTTSYEFILNFNWFCHLYLFYLTQFEIRLTHW